MAKEELDKVADYFFEEYGYYPTNEELYEYLGIDDLIGLDESDLY